MKYTELFDSDYSVSEFTANTKDGKTIQGLFVNDDHVNNVDEFTVYDIRYADKSCRLATIEPFNRVAYNHAGTLLVPNEEAFNLGKDDYVELQDTTLNGVPYQELPQILVMYTNHENPVTTEEMQLINDTCGDDFEYNEDNSNGWFAVKLNCSYDDANELVDKLNGLTDDNNWFVGDAYENYID